jgi:galactokinase
MVHFVHVLSAVWIVYSTAITVMVMASRRRYKRIDAEYAERVRLTNQAMELYDRLRAQILSLGLLMDEIKHARQQIRHDASDVRLCPRCGDGTTGNNAA